MLYRISLYNLPYTRNGVRYPFPSYQSSSQYLNYLAPFYKCIEKYTLHTFYTEKPFADDQKNLIFSTEISEQTNYVRVACTTDENKSYPQYDFNARYFWVDRVVFMGSDDDTNLTSPVKLEITPDYIAQCLFWGARTDWVDYGFSGTLERSNDPSYTQSLAVFSTDIIYDLPFTPQKYKYSIENFYNTDTETEFDTTKYDFVSTVDNNGQTQILCSRGGVDLKFLSGATKIRDADGSDERTCSALKCFILSREFVPQDELSKQYLLASTAVSSGAFFTVYGFPSNSPSWTNDIDGYYTFDPTSVGTKFYLLTPSRCEQIIADTSTQLNISIHVECAMYGIGVDTVDITVYPKSTMRAIDISGDYDCMIAVNDAAQRQAQFSSAYMLKNAVSVFGAVGGAIGGFASGNVFGGVSAIAGGASSIVDQKIERESPATVKSAGNALNGLSRAFPIGLLVATPDLTSDEILQKRYFGCVARSSPYVEFVLYSPSNTTLMASRRTYFYVKMKSVDRILGVGMSADARAQIEQRLKNGILFCRETWSI